MKIHNHHVRAMWVFLQVYIKEDTFHFVVLISNKVNVGVVNIKHHMKFYTVYSEKAPFSQDLWNLPSFPQSSFDSQ